MKIIYVKLLFVLFFVLIMMSLVERPKKEEKVKDYIVNVSIGDEVKEIELDTYLLGVIAGEMPASFELEALKAQAVASRTFVLSRKLKVDNTTKTQVYLTDEQMKKKWKDEYVDKKEKIKKAINETKNEVMKYDGEYISALFFSSSNGKTVDCGDYFEGDKEYLKSVESPWDKTTDKTYKREKVYTKDQLIDIFNSTNMRITSYTKSGYVEKVIIDGKEYTGREVREKLNLASSCFEIKLTSKGYVFTTYGSGHGVGMSQYGAQGMAKENKTYKDILHHYYQNIEIVSI